LDRLCDEEGPGRLLALAPARRRPRGAVCLVSGWLAALTKTGNQIVVADMKIRLIVASLVCLAVPAYAQGTVKPNPEPSAEKKAATMRHNQEIVAKTPGAEGVFIAREDGVKHVQSGLVCPPFPNVSLSQTNVFPSAQKGESVSCDYSRADKTGAVV